jgi:hypothetical protein
MPLLTEFHACVIKSTYVALMFMSLAGPSIGRVPPRGVSGVGSDAPHHAGHPVQVHDTT